MPNGEVISSVGGGGKQEVGKEKLNRVLGCTWGKVSEKGRKLEEDHKF